MAGFVGRGVYDARQTKAMPGRTQSPQSSGGFNYSSLVSDFQKRESDLKVLINNPDMHDVDQFIGRYDMIIVNRGSVKKKI